MTRVVGVIPARYGSTRFPGKPLADILGRPMVRWVYEAAARALETVVVATDDRRIFSAVRSFGGNAVMTPASCASGTERTARVARQIRADYYVNIQGDEPLLDAATVRKTVALARRRRAIATPVVAMRPGDVENPNAVKAVLGDRGRALYFSRAAIPFPRDGETVRYYKHVGLYAYPRAALLKFVSLPPTSLERIERLEQLRALYYGMPIYAVATAYDSVGVDTPADLRKVAARLKKGAFK